VRVCVSLARSSSMCVCVRVSVWLCVFDCLCGEGCVSDQPYGWLSPHVARRRRAVLIARPAAPRAAARAVLIARPAAPRAAARARLRCSAIGFRCRARSAAGITWTSRTASAPWAGRAGHTSVIDAAGAINVIGGRAGDGGGATYFNDVWVSTDGGA
jgi:hypothetical protein